MHSVPTGKRSEKKSEGGETTNTHNGLRSESQCTKIWTSRRVKFQATLHWIGKNLATKSSAALNHNSGPFFKKTEPLYTQILHRIKYSSLHSPPTPRFHPPKEKKKSNQARPDPRPIITLIGNNITSLIQEGDTTRFSIPPTLVRQQPNILGQIKAWNTPLDATESDIRSGNSNDIGAFVHANGGVATSPSLPL